VPEWVALLPDEVLPVLRDRTEHVAIQGPDLLTYAARHGGLVLVERSPGPSAARADEQVRGSRDRERQACGAAASQSDGLMSRNRPPAAR
jgi:hypothetical protein